MALHTHIPICRQIKGLLRARGDRLASEAVAKQAGDYGGGPAAMLRFPM